MSSAVRKFQNKTYILRKQRIFRCAVFCLYFLLFYKKYRKALRFPAMSSLLRLKRKLIKENNQSISTEILSPVRLAAARMTTRIALAILP